ncbi:MAG: hypothetical protein A2161_01940 [Candidatus Schekmanbacteria bacterium RBG_13_48_7]|uniref:Zinc-finger domain-containing protein n=1 Tax=Candidatus Schekmanbacteria bacterium RBG_13_48_7 TaxID=1817878 RepID=A0A1F7RYM1_9BACT|nr:MAG: hypothetical protein A2161_01940 [Candidatus Schekmanbacteria bacterium RBG_13_48_7]
MLTCKEVAQLVSDSFENKLPLFQRIGMWIHYLMCRQCLEYHRQIHFLRKIYQLYTSELDIVGSRLNASLSAEARENIKVLLRNAAR